ncbi:MAG TPA: hypothetical protein VIW03_11325, partial [Anaeromyxobacter sp.]
MASAPARTPGSGGGPPGALVETLRREAASLAARAAAFGDRPDVRSSLQGGGVAINRLELFAAARQALGEAPPGSWIALADAAGTAHAWWGDAPSPLSSPRDRDGLGVRWSATTVTLLVRRTIPGHPEDGYVYSARTISAETPDFARALGLSGPAEEWEPVAPGGPGVAAVASGDGTPFLGLRRAEVSRSHAPAGRTAALAVAAVAALLLLGRADRAVRTGAALLLLFFAAEVALSPEGRALADMAPWIFGAGLAFLPLSLAAMWNPGAMAMPRRAWRLAAAPAFLLLALFSAFLVHPPGLGSRFAGSPAALLRVAGLTALALDAVALASSAVRPGGRSSVGLAVAASTAALGLALGLVAPSGAYVAFLASASLVALFLWARAVGEPTGRDAMRPLRLLGGAALLAILAGSGISEHARAAAAMRRAASVR